MKLNRKMSISLASIIGIIALLITAVPTFADNSPAIGDSVDIDGIEWQMVGDEQGGGNHSEYWTMYVTGEDTTFTVGPGREDFPGSGEFACSTTAGCQEANQDVYTARQVYSAEMIRTKSVSINTRSPALIWFDKGIMAVVTQEVASVANGSLGYSHVFRLSAQSPAYSDWPSNRDLSGGESWTEVCIYDPATATSWGESCNDTCVDAGNAEKRIDIDVDDNTTMITTNGMQFETYRLVKDTHTCTNNGDEGCTNSAGSIDYEYWDKDGALACPIRLDDRGAFEQENRSTLYYHDWPGEPTVFTCDSSETPKTDFGASEDVWISGHWVTLAASYDNDCLYDVYVGTGVPTSGASLSTWGTDTGTNIDVGPQCDVACNEPGTFFANLGDLSDGEGLTIVLDEGDGVYYPDDQVFEGSGDTWGVHTSRTGDTEHDDGTSNTFDKGDTGCTDLPTAPVLSIDTVGDTSIAMSESTSTDPCSVGLEYYFERLTPSTANSGWIGTNSWTDTPLANCTAYTYQVTTRNANGSSSPDGDGDTTGDDTDPTISDVPNQNEDLDANCEVVLPDYTGLATTDDNCGSVTVTQDPVASTVITVDTLVTLTADDGNGNTADDTFTVIVADNTDPTISDVSDQDEGVQTCAYSLPDYTGLATTDDNCGTVTVTQDPVAGTMISVPTLVTLTADDGNGNTADDTFTCTFTCAPTTVTVNVDVTLEGSRDATSGAIVGTVIFHADGATWTEGSNNFSGTPLHTFAGITSVYQGGNVTRFTCAGVDESTTYDVTVVGDHSLLNVKEMVIGASSPQTESAGTLLEGDSDLNNAVNMSDFGVWKNALGSAPGDASYNAGANFDNNLAVNMTDFGLMKSNLGLLGPRDA